MRNIVVTGDLILDYHLVQHPVTPSYHREHLRHTVLHRQLGGAWYLKEMLGIACSDLDVSIRCPTFAGEPDTEPHYHVNRSYSVWSLYRREKNSKERVWRISKFLGYQPPPPKGVRLLEVKDDLASPDLLVLDDLGLGFRDRPNMWPKALRRGGRPRSVVMKTVAPLGEGPLWEHLRAHHLDKLTLIVRVKDLRLRRATISSSLSWDSTIEEIVDEFENGLSARDLAMCRRVIVHFEDAGAAVFTRRPTDHSRLPDSCAGGNPEARLLERSRLERFIYHPEELEGTWLSRRPGITYGTSSIMAAQMVRRELEPSTSSLCSALTLGLAAMKVNHECGGGSQQGFVAGIPDKELKQVFHPGNRDKPPAGAVAHGYESYPSVYCTAFPHDILSDERLRLQPHGESNLLRDLTGAGFDFVEVKATEVVVRGWEQALSFAPKARYGKYLTVDREEIERINAIRSMILSYQNNPEDRQPLSIAVFGPPGSGKSFAIKQLASELFAEEKAILEFNLSQFRGTEDLHTAFHRVRDASIQGQVPLVFWDEFDTDKLTWLKEFLVPLQDAKFQAGSHLYPFGKSIFIFAGGTHPNFESFDRSQAARDEGKEFRAFKGPDFVSRLRGYVNIKGPNPRKTHRKPQESRLVEVSVGEVADANLNHDAGDVEHLIRRAILLRSAIERYRSHLIDQKTKFALISPSVIRGFLRVKEFLHGARSLEAVVTMSALTESNYFGVADLPSPDLLGLHVTPDFLGAVHDGQVLAPAVEAIAGEYHEQRRKARASSKASRRPRRGAPNGVEAVRYSELSEIDKEVVRTLARLLPAKLRQLGYRIVPLASGTNGRMRRMKFSNEELLQLRKIEHDIWLRIRLLKGFEWGAKSSDTLLLHSDIVPFDRLGVRGEGADVALAGKLPGVLWRNGYALDKDSEA